MLSSRIHTYALVVTLILLGTAAFGTTWDASAGWSSTNNPSGAWSYGWTDTPGGAITAYVREQVPPANSSEWSTYPDETHGNIARYNDTGKIVLTDSGRAASAIAGRGTVLRWTSPVGGNVRVISRFEGALGMWGRFPSVNVSVYQNSTRVYSAYINNQYGLYPFDSTLTVSVGDKIDFVVSWTDDGGAQLNYIPLYAVITNDSVGSISGHVTGNLTGHPAIGAAEVATPDGKYHTRSGSDGGYSLSVPAGTYSITAAALGFVSTQADGILVAGGPATKDFDLAGGVISGTVTASESGSPVSGALVRTDGEPTHSAVTAGDGSYSISVPGDSYTVLVSATGRVPVRTSASVAAGASTTANAALDLPQAGSLVSLPAPVSCGQPPSAPSAPGDSFPVSFADLGAISMPGTPKIAACSDTVKPDESFTMTGSAFTTRVGSDMGSDTIVWIWARTSSSGGTLRQAKVWRATENTITALVPDDIAFGMFMVWVENANGVSAPFCINKTTANWVGPLGNVVQAGNKKRVFGRNISYGHGTATSYVYIQPTTGGSFIPCPVNSVNPYMVEFTVPVGTANGNYRVYVHNGHGGVYGWSDGLDLVVQPDWVRGTATRSLTPSGADDTSAIQGAIDYLTSQPNGGTLNLSAGNFIVKNYLDLKSNVLIKGSGMSQTAVLLQLASSTHTALRIIGDRIGISDLTIRDCAGFTPPQYCELSTYWYDATGCKFTNMKLIADTGVTTAIGFTMGYNVEMSGCEIYRRNSPQDGCWLHNNNFYGDYFDAAEAGTYPNGIGITVENNHFETQSWPVNPGNGSRNYTDFLTYDQYKYQAWCKRVALTSGWHTYLANSTTKDVAVQDNRGEMVLFHGMSGFWWGQVLANNGVTMSLKTDGLVNGQQMFVNNYNSPEAGIYGNVPVPDAQPYYQGIQGKSVVIVSGKGKGQTRQLIAYTPNSITVDSPWSIQPDSTSMIAVTPLYLDHVVYNNDLNAFPVGYTQQYSASCGPDVDGNGWRVMAEGNTSRRTFGGRSILGRAPGVTYWCEMRGEKAYDVNCGALNTGGECFPVGGPVLLGNAWRGNEIVVNGSNPPTGYTVGGVISGQGEGLICENINITSKRGYRLAGVAGDPYGASGVWQDGFALYRNGTITTTDSSSQPSSAQPVDVVVSDGKQFLINNKYVSSASTYFQEIGVSPYSIPVPMYRAVKFSGNVGYPLSSQIIPIANAGIASLTWTAAPSDAWITASIQSNSSLPAESTMGRLVVAVNTSGLSSGKTWGYVDVSNGVSTVRVGVCADLASGSPSNQLPVASFNATPTAGTTPLLVSFDATASYDPDGSIASYSWDYGDGTYGSGVTSSHTYPVSGVYTPVLSVTDNGGASSKSWTNVSAFAPIVFLTLSGTPVPPIDVNTPVNLSVTSSGGYQVQYRFLYKDSTGWHTLRDYQAGTSVTWTPSVAGCYELKAQARSTGSTNQFDFESNTLSYPVGLIPTGMKLWLKADAGVGTSGSLVSSWLDQSGTGNNVTQNNSTYKPAKVDNVMNGHPVIRFQGSLQYLTSTTQVLNGNTSFTTFTVGDFQQIPSSTPQYFWSNGPDSSSSGYGLCLYISGFLRASWGGGGSALYDLNPATTGSWYKVSTRYSTSSQQHELWVNGTYIGPRSKGSFNLSGGNFCVGNLGSAPSSGLYGDVAEIIIYDKVLSDSDRANVEQYLSGRWSTPIATPIDRLKDVKALGDGVLVSITSPKTAIIGSGVYSDGSIYVSEADRTCGLKVTGAGTVGVYDNLTLTGTTDTDPATGERVLRVSTVTDTPATDLTVVRSLGMTNKAFSPTGQFVTVWGKVTAKNSSYLTIDDGSGSPAKVQIDGLLSPISPVPAIGQYISATGPAGYMASGVPALRLRSAGDIRVY